MKLKFVGGRRRRRTLGIIRGIRERSSCVWFTAIKQMASTDSSASPVPDEATTNGFVDDSALPDPRRLFALPADGVGLERLPSRDDLSALQAPPAPPAAPIRSPPKKKSPLLFCGCK